MNPPYRVCVCGRRAECRKQKPAGQKNTHTLSSLPETTVKHKLKNCQIRPHFVRRECQVPQRVFCLAVWYNLRQYRIILSADTASEVRQLPERCLSRKAGIVRCCLKKPWKPQRTPAALCLTSCLCLRNICHFLCFQKHLDRLLCCLASSLNRYRSSCMP